MLQPLWEAPLSGMIGLSATKSFCGASRYGLVRSVPRFWFLGIFGRMESRAMILRTPSEASSRPSHRRQEHYLLAHGLTGQWGSGVGFRRPAGQAQARRRRRQRHRS